MILSRERRSGNCQLRRIMVWQWENHDSSRHHKAGRELRKRIFSREMRVVAPLSPAQPWLMPRNHRNYHRWLLNTSASRKYTWYKCVSPGWGTPVSGNSECSWWLQNSIFSCGEQLWWWGDDVLESWHSEAWQRRDSHCWALTRWQHLSSSLSGVWLRWELMASTGGWGQLREPSETLKHQTILNKILQQLTTFKASSF